MPMVYTIVAVIRDLKMCNLSMDGTEEEQRERLAHYFDEKYQDHLAAWEVRTGKPWTDMSYAEAELLLQSFPKLMSNPGLLSRLLARK